MIVWITIALFAGTMAAGQTSPDQVRAQWTTPAGPAKRASLSRRFGHRSTRSPLTGR
jgi:hypothetical protein